MKTTELVANIGIGNEIVRNDFDSMPIYREIRKEVDSYGNVFVRIPKFYIKKESIEGLYDIKISKEKMEGYYLPMVFWDFEKNKELDYYYHGAHEASISSDGLRLESKSGVLPAHSKNIVQFRTLAKANGKGYQQNDIHAIDVIQALFYVEFGTLNSQSIHAGLTDGANKSPSITGFSDGITASSGAMGVGGKFPFVYRGIENPFGSMWEFVDGININEFQSWIALNADEYTSNVFAEPYKKLSYINSNTNGYAISMGFDKGYQFAEIPVSVRGSGSTYYSDYYYQATGQRIALFGGRWTYGSNAGLSCWSLDNSSDLAHSTVGARLLKKAL